MLTSFKKETRSILMKKMIAMMLALLMVLSFAACGAKEEEAPAPKVEVWRENGMMKEHLKVSSDGKRYYDPEDGEWHPIK